MTADKLIASLRALVQEHGIGQVSRSLDEIGTTLGDSPGKVESSASSADLPTEIRVDRKKRRVTALERVAKMELSKDKTVAVAELARRFDEKTFMPTFGDIAYFCQLFDVEVPESKSRSSAIPRVFRAIAGMDVEDIQTMLDYGMFSGPSRLGPIADAIGRNGRAR
ncbi:MAG: hypothetical protein OXT07_13840 [bacterium]|nr:hypothetical protein [bacterium]